MAVRRHDRHRLAFMVVKVDLAACAGTRPAAEVGSVGAHAAARAVQSRLPPAVCTGGPQPWASAHVVTSPATKLADLATCKHVTVQFSVPALVRCRRSICRFVALQEINAASAAPGGDPLSAWALERFWRPAAGGVAAPPLEPLPVLGASAGGTSRYLTDFQVHFTTAQLHRCCTDCASSSALYDLHSM